MSSFETAIPLKQRYRPSLSHLHGSENKHLCGQAFQFAIRLFVSVIMQLQIRLGLKAELGALYPLLLLRPLEATILDPVLLTVTLTGIKRIAMEPQMQVYPITSFASMCISM